MMTIDRATASLPNAREMAVSLATRYADEVRARFGDRLRGIRLYGSAARGDWTPSSDVDLLVLLDTVADADIEWLVNRAFRLGPIENQVLLQPVVMSADEYAELLRRERRFALDVEWEGMPI